MKTIIILVLILIALLSVMTKAQVNSDITYDPGTSVEVQSGADVCANNVFINGTYSGGGSICTGALPVSLSSFTFSADKRNVTLMWVTEWELNNKGFRVERTFAAENSWKEIAFIEGKGTSNVSNGYMYKDEKLKTADYKYRIKQEDYNGNYEYFELGTVVKISPPLSFDMGQNYPNPGNPNTKINFEMPVNGKVSIVVFDMLGREVVTMLNENRAADYYTVEFNGSNIASGVYFYRMYAEGEGQKFTKTMKMIIVK
ncbi:MAG TPA: T9SS type A sorting domain-containing protein [Ignavibacteria bacterium]|nr:hypothetical protein [Bacteroidota bacterium]HRE12529.1 T9SS type A sorting domain-containing protein [Ignavibacteria bacterium]HRF66309.1 T9SS type A sorting domain-containing protein [Ignavibacteria bacterium]HRJ05731.1 T9SS type A sorting domain-containing protein [Ignavibacteria bacterium]HRJ86330.1 T9SS type A sorting domain-containing protein [Ignavibacteria bacterium]